MTPASDHLVEEGFPAEAAWLREYEEGRMEVHDLFEPLRRFLPGADSTGLREAMHRVYALVAIDLTFGKEFLAGAGKADGAGD